MSALGPPQSTAEVAIVTVMLDRATGKVTLDTTFSTPGETAIMLEYANEIADAVVDLANGRERADDA
jgi:hypothetical protein